MSDREAAELMRKRLLAELDAATEPLTTAELRQRLDGVNEQIYRGLGILERRGRVRRIRRRGRHVAWEIASGQGNDQP